MTVGPRAPAYPFAEVDGLVFSPQFALLREQGSLARVHLPYGGDAWLATRYDVVRFVLSDRRFSLAATRGQDIPRDTPFIDPETNLMSLDPPEHTRLRRLMATSLTASSVGRLRPRAQLIVDGLLDVMVAAGSPADLIEALAMPFPHIVICELLGVPTTDRDRVLALADASLSLTAHSEAEISEARDRLKTYIVEQIRDRRRTPADDLLGALVHARDAGDRLTEDELVMLGWMMLAANKTTTDQLGNVVYLLLTQPQHLAQLRADPQLLPLAVEEFLRYTPLGAGAGFARIATADVQVGDVLVRAGEAVLVKMSAANRDGRAFDQADELALDRAPNRHIAFGFGPHFCPGAELTRMEMQVALGALLDRFPKLALAIAPEDIRWKHGRRDRGVYQLPITWETGS